MDWDAAHARDVAQALAEHYGFPFAEATDFLWRRQLRQAEEAGAQPPDGEDEDEEVQDAVKSSRITSTRAASQADTSSVAPRCPMPRSAQLSSRLFSTGIHL
jgi:hypothetical protein